MDNNKKRKGGKKKFPLSIITNNWGYKITAILGAVLVWAYVLNVQNPQREKKVDDVPIYVRGEDALRSEGQLVLATAKADLGEATVTVSLPAINSVNKNALNIYADVSGIKRAGEYEIPLEYETTQGKIVSVSPASITVEIDELESKEVPIQIEFTDELPEGYWHGNAVYSPTSYTVQGPKKIVERIQKAVCYVSLNRTTSYQDSLRLVLLDENDAVVDSTNFTSALPSVALTMTIWPQKKVPVQLEEAITGKVADTHEIISKTVKPAEVTVAAPQNELDQINSLDIDSVSLGDGKQSVTRSVQILKKFSDIKLIEGERIEVHIEIAEKSNTLKLVDLPIVVRNLDRSLEVGYQNIETVSVEFKGPNSQIALLKRDNITLYIDCKDLTAGGYQLPLQIEQPDNTGEVVSTFDAETVSITLREKS